MPENLLEDSTFDDPVTSPVGSDPLRAVSWKPTHQKLANRTRYLKDQRGAANGVASLDANSVVNERVHGAIVASDQQTQLVAQAGLVATVYTDIAGTTITFAGLLEGDVVMIEGSAKHIGANALAESYVRAAITEDGPATTTGSAWVSRTNNVDTQGSVFMKHVLGATPGDVTVRLQHKTDNASAAGTVRSCTIRAWVYRP